MSWLTLYIAILVIFLCLKFGMRFVSLSWKYAGWILFFIILVWIIPHHFPEVVEWANQREGMR